MKKIVFYSLFFILVFSLTCYSVLSGVDLSRMFFYIREADDRYIILSILCVLIYILGESVVIKYLLGTRMIQVPFGHCCLYSFIGFFYSCITPSASGGQPMQVVAMRKDRIPVAVSTVILAIVTITYKLVLVVIGLAVMVIRPSGVIGYLDQVQWLIYLGLILNVVCILAFIAMIFDQNLVRKMMEFCMKILTRIHLIRDPQKLYQRLERVLEQYQGTAEYFSDHKEAVIHAFLITFIQRLALFSVTWLCYRSLHLEGTSAFTVITLQAMVAVAVDMMPLPGGMGISETLFMVIFLPVFGNQQLHAGMILSRGISYYTQLLISGFMTVAASLILKRKE